jgi:hypothetical protein
MERRIQRLSEFLRGAGCRNCRHWNVTEVEFVDANTPPRDRPPRPGRCPDCGRAAPPITELIRIIRDEDDVDAAIVGG